MSDLPDLDTSQISFIAYWNAIDDGGVGSIDPEDVLTDGSINEYTVYDNGIHIDRYDIGHREIQARVKSDGWMIAYLDRTETLQTGTETKPNGPWDLMTGWPDGDITAGTTTLHESIKSLQAELSNSGIITFNLGDVSLYNYEHPHATATTLMSSASNADGGSLSYSDTTTIHKAYVTGYYDTDFEGFSIATSSADGNTYGSVDLQAQNLIPDPNTSYSKDNGWMWLMVIWS